MGEIKIEESWKALLNKEFNKTYFLALKAFLVQEKNKNQLIYPPSHKIFEAFNLTPFNQVKVVILGQDPYHSPNQAHGLSFSVNEDIKIPPSLQNIFKELQTDIIGFTMPKNGNLTSWAQQGVLLLNATLTVKAGEAGSHQKKGWETFTDEVIRQISLQKENVVFMLWGRYAQSKENLINTQKHLVLKSVHPSPLAAYNGFFGSKHFSFCNNYLMQNDIEPIDWQLKN